MQVSFPIKTHGLRVLIAVGLFSGVLPLTADIHRTLYHSTTTLTRVCHEHPHSRLTNQRGEGMDHVFCPQPHVHSIFFSGDPNRSISRTPYATTTLRPAPARFVSTIRIRFKSRDPPSDRPDFV